MIASPLAAQIDFEALLWVPKPIIVVPANYQYRELTIQMMEDVLKRIYLPQVKEMFDQDDMFYRTIARGYR